eukprot:1151508-Pelagomonas_calceolata.AAC.1
MEWRDPEVGEIPSFSHFPWEKNSTWGAKRNSLGVKIGLRVELWALLGRSEARRVSRVLQLSPIFGVCTKNMVGMVWFEKENGERAYLALSTSGIAPAWC